MRICSLFLWGLLLSSATVLAGESAEFRGVWVARFEWASPDGDQCRERIRSILDSIAEANFNAVVFQVRGSAETLYPSDLEPWSPLVGPEGPGFDPLAFAIAEAAKRDIEFHAYVNPMPLRSIRAGEPLSKQHLWHRHGPDSEDPWVCVDPAGEPAKVDYFYLSPGIPAVHVYLRRVVLDLVRRYDVAGIHFDRIRYPGRQFSHDPVSRQRFLGVGNPLQLEWEDWQRSQIDKWINDVSAEIRAEKPEVVISCAAWGIYRRDRLPGYQGFSSGFHDYYQDTWQWVKLGAMDVLMPMIYWDLPEPKPNYDELVAEFVEGVGAEHVVGGQRVFSPAENRLQIELTRKLQARGTVLWSHRPARRSGVMEHLQQTLYREQVPVPPLARIRRPEHGTILGTVVRSDGAALVDAWISVAPIQPDTSDADVFQRTWTSSGDGRFAFLRVPAGAVRVTARHPQATGEANSEVIVRAGHVAPIELQLSVTDQQASAAVSPAAPQRLATALKRLAARDAWKELPSLDIPQHPAEKFLEGWTIVLDPGHGGGKRPQVALDTVRNREADMNFRVARLLESLLIQGDAQVVMTRDGDYDLSLAARAEVANNLMRKQPNNAKLLFISIHHNSGGRTANYTSVWFHGNPDRSEPDLDAARCVAHSLGAAIRTQVGRASPLMSDQQMYERGFGVLRHCHVPAMLIECSFYSNPDERRRLADAHYNLREAYAIYRGLCEFAYGGRPTQSQPTATWDGAELKIISHLDDGLPQDWWGADRNRILSSTLRAYFNDREMQVEVARPSNQLVATLAIDDAVELPQGELRLHFANFLKHHNWPQRYQVHIAEAGKASDCVPLPAQRLVSKRTD